MTMLALKCLTLLGRFWLRRHGVQLGRGGWVHGLPQVRRRGGASIQIGNEVSLCSLSRFNPLAPARRLSLITNSDQARIVIKDGAGISNSVISCFESITIGENTLVGAECLIVDSDFHEIPLGEGKSVRTAPVEIGDHVFIGTRSIILKGVKIGRKSVVGAGSVVTGEVPPYSLVAGNPARIIRTFEPAGNSKTDDRKI